MRRRFKGIFSNKSPEDNLQSSNNLAVPSQSGDSSSPNRTPSPSSFAYPPQIPLGQQSASPQPYAWPYLPPGHPHPLQYFQPPTPQAVDTGQPPNQTPQLVYPYGAYPPPQFLWHPPTGQSPQQPQHNGQQLPFRTQRSSPTQNAQSAYPELASELPEDPHPADNDLIDLGLDNSSQQVANASTVSSLPSPVGPRDEGTNSSHGVSPARQSAAADNTFNPFDSQHRSSVSTTSINRSTVHTQAATGQTVENPQDITPFAESPVSQTRIPESNTNAEYLREQGNQCVERQDFSQALRLYNMAIDYAPHNAILYANRSLAHMKLDPPDLENALRDAKSATELDPRYGKGWARLGDVKLAKKDPRGAKEAYEQAQLMGNVGQATRSGLDTAIQQLNGGGMATQRLQSPQGSLSPNQPTRPADSTPTSPPVVAPPSTLVSPQSGTSLGQLPSVNQRPTSQNLAQSQPATSLPTAGSSVPLRETPTSGVQGAPQNARRRLPNQDSSATQASATASALPSRLADALDSARNPGTDSLFDTTEPPSYTPNTNSTDPLVAAMSREAILTQVDDFEVALRDRNKGSVTIAPYVAPGNVDSVMILYIGMGRTHLTLREHGENRPVHTSFTTQHIGSLQYPGGTFLDMDKEVSAYLQGKLPGTVCLTGYSEVYREDQLGPTRLNLVLEDVRPLPLPSMDRIVQLLTNLRIGHTTRTPQAQHQGLQEILGTEQVPGVYSPLTSTVEGQITTLCLVLNRYDPAQFVDLSKSRSVCNKTATANMNFATGLHRFLYQVLLGAELLVRLLKQPTTTNRAGYVSDAISSLLLIADLWMSNVDVVRSGMTQNFHVVSRVYQRQIDGLLYFAEQLRWPFMEETRKYAETAYSDLSSGKSTGTDLCDWLFGLVRPGIHFRHMIMSCLVDATPTTRAYQNQPLFDSGLVLSGRSYWPERTVLGGVLGGLKNVKSICGWVGPAPGPENNVRGWVRVTARKLRIPVPCVKPVDGSEDDYEWLMSDPNEHNNSVESSISQITTITNWIEAKMPERPATENSSVSFKAIRLQALPQAQQALGPAGLVAAAGRTDYRAILDFEVNGIIVSYTLYTLPTFVCAHPCVGTHVMHRKLAEKLQRQCVRACELPDTFADQGFLLIDATRQGEELLARAWCAEKGKHAIVRRGLGTCLTCAVNQTKSSSGLAYNVLIWSATN
ncbi:MAG: hypothetical protein M1833_001264 [Piccolia ochrophora]|nr:MAG: hypothetical protein M1833_001264 [Piccolia ochrophora]